MRPRPTRAAALVLLLAASAGCAGDATSPPVDDTPAQLVVVGGDTQFAAVAMPVAAAPTVEVRNAAGRPLAGVTVVFAVSGGGGWTTTAGTVTDARGRASTTWYLGPSPGSGHSLQAATSNGSAGATFRAGALPLKPDSTYYGRNQYIAFTAGGLPLIVSAPHGGALTPPELPDRTSGETVTDTNTQELAGTIAATCQQRTGKRPHLVISRLKRTKLDPNREIGEAAQGNAGAEIAWREWHGFLEAARQAVENGGGGLYLDVHGHGHPIARAELGYLLSAAQLALGDDQLNAPASTSRTSIRALAARSPSGLAGLLRGPQSLGTLLAARGFPAVPSSAQPAPGSDPYFTGGYNTQRHGSLGGGLVDAVQIELPFPGVRDSDAHRGAFATALLEALQVYFPAHYGKELR